ncbi:hypothetical protein NC651_033279 [Populus alba x Populus x berolinensis]|nr:hypothetical protein NC651_033279 [Populus alba x Populus x berolinensis]
MVKLASARESRIYGPRLARNRGEYVNAGLCVFAAIVLVGGFVAELSKEPKSGLVLLLIALLLIMVVNLHDLVAHLAGIDYRFPLMGFDTQLALVEFAVPVVQASGALLSFLGQDLGLDRHLWKSNDFYRGVSKRSQGVLVGQP